MEVELGIYSKQLPKQRKESYNKNRMIESIPNNYQNKGMTYDSHNSPIQERIGSSTPSRGEKKKSKQ
jgi:hypothetical protein